MFWNKKKKLDNGVITQTDGEHTWQLQHVYTDTFDNKWYQLIDAETLPSKRYAAMEIKQSYLDIGVDKFTLDSAINMTKQLIDNGDTDNVIKLWDIIKDRLTFDFNRRNVLDMACTMYIVNDEKIYNFSEHYDQLKKDAFAKDGDCADFFLTNSYEIIKKLNQKYDKYKNLEIIELIKKDKRMANSFGNLITKLERKNTTT